MELCGVVNLILRWTPFLFSLPPYFHFSPSSCFTSLCYTADGQCILAGGRSKFVCIYNVAHQILLKKFQISRNLAFDGMMVHLHTCAHIQCPTDCMFLQQYLNSSRMTDAGPLDLLSGDEGEDGDGGPRIELPGVTKGK